MRQYRVATLGDYGNYYSYFLMGTMEGAIRGGHWFWPISLFHSGGIEDIEKRLNLVKPHILFCHCIFNRQPHNRQHVLDMLARVRERWGTKICYHMGDARDTPRYPHDISNYVDIGLVNNAEPEEWSGVWKIPCYHWPYAGLYQPFISKINPEFQYELVYTGGLFGRYHEGRTPFLENLKGRVSVKVFPDEQWGNSMFLTNEISASARAVLGIQIPSNMTGYQDVRPFQYIGAGALYFHNKCPQMDQFFEAGKHYVGFESPEDLVEKFKYYSNNFEEARDIREEGFRFCQKYHSTAARMQFVVDVFEGNNLKPIYLEEINETS